MKKLIKALRSDEKTLAYKIAVESIFILSAVAVVSFGRFALITVFA